MHREAGRRGVKGGKFLGRRTLHVVKKDRDLGQTSRTEESGDRENSKSVLLVVCWTYAAAEGRNSRPRKGKVEAGKGRGAVPEQEHSQ